MDPEDCLRSLTAEALLWAHPDRTLFPVSLGLMAVANAFVMLGLLPEPRVEAMLAEHRAALERKGIGKVWGVSKGELTVRPGAHQYWESRAAGPAGLREVPVLVAAAGVLCPTSAAEVCFEWVKLTSTGLRVSFRATAADPGGNTCPPAPHVSMRQAMSEISVRDDSGHSYDLTVEPVGWSRGRSRGEQEWHGQVLLDPAPTGPPVWLEFIPACEGASGRVGLLPPVQAPVGTSEAPWPTPAEGYLAELALVTSYSIGEATAGPEETAEIVATVADSLLAVGALPVTSTLLGEFPGSRAPAWQLPLVSRWGRRAHQRAVEFRASEHRGLAARIPLEHATAMIESVSAQGELVGVQVYGHPWVMGEYWPMITPCFQVHAVDDAGNEHNGMPGDWQGFPGNEGHGSFFLWPPVDPARKSIRVTVSTLWEAAWAEVELPR
jgi:hypothetical protein